MKELIISADSHVIEPADLWSKNLPAWAIEHLPAFGKREAGPGGRPSAGEGMDPRTRIEEIAVDGVDAEVLYPTLGLGLFGMDHAAAQEAAFEVYNDYLADYCNTHPDRLWGVASISAYNMDNAVTELERSAKAGLKGAMLWAVPHAELPFFSEHYYPFWEAAQALKLPVSLHILTGHNYTKFPEAYRDIEWYRATIHSKLQEASAPLFDLVFFGILERYPDLKIVSVENEIGWMPFLVQQWDYYVGRHGAKRQVPLKEKPSHYFFRQVYATFVNDPAGGHNFTWWGQNNCMWSNDYPHSKSTWPDSKEVIDRDIACLTPDVRRKLLSENVARLYDLKLPTPLS